MKAEESLGHFRQHWCKKADLRGTSKCLYEESSGANIFNHKKQLSLQSVEEQELDELYE